MFQTRFFFSFERRELQERRVTSHHRGDYSPALHGPPSLPTPRSCEENLSAEPRKPSRLFLLHIYLFISYSNSINTCFLSSRVCATGTFRNKQNG